MHEAGACAKWPSRLCYRLQSGFNQASTSKTSRTLVKPQKSLYKANDSQRVSLVPTGSSRDDRRSDPVVLALAAAEAGAGGVGRIRSEHRHVVGPRNARGRMKSDQGGQTVGPGKPFLEKTSDHTDWWFTWGYRYALYMIFMNQPASSKRQSMCRAIMIMSSHECSRCFMFFGNSGKHSAGPSRHGILILRKALRRPCLASVCLALTSSG